MELLTAWSRPITVDTIHYRESAMFLEYLYWFLLMEKSEPTPTSHGSFIFAALLITAERVLARKQQTHLFAAHQVSNHVASFHINSTQWKHKNKAHSCVWGCNATHSSNCLTVRLDCPWEICYPRRPTLEHVSDPAVCFISRILLSTLKAARPIRPICYFPCLSAGSLE